MKKIVFAFWIFTCSTVFSFSAEKEIDFAVSPYEIISDEYNAAVPDGYFALIGNVYDSNTKKPVADAGITNYVENQSKLSSTTTDSFGYFKMIFSITDSAIYCYKLDLNEVVLTGPFKNRHVIKVKIYLEVQTAVAFKPVVYAYNAASTILFNLKPIGGFTFTYPKSNGMWNVKTNNDGTLTDLSTGKNYPYIFWEGMTENLKFKISENKLSGYLIKTDTCLQFLENVLTQYGLNEKESTDFITFWGPRISKKDFALIQFLSTENYSESIAELSITPKPDALLRLYMFFMPLDFSELNIEIVEPKIETFKRNGFTVVEWGGSILHQNQLIN